MMEKMTMSRRIFNVQIVGGVLAATLHQTAAKAEPTQPVTPFVRLGGPVETGGDDPERFARIHREREYRAAYCPDVQLKDTDRIRAYADAFAKYDIVIAEVGRWCNLLDADPEKRRANLDNCTDGLALAEEIGARCCVNITGSHNREVWSGPHPENLTKKCFDEVVENARKIIDAVKPKRAKFAYEMMGWCIPDSVDGYLELIKAIDRPGFAVHLDPCNIINSPRRFYASTDLLNECFDKLGPHIVSCHAKDLAWDIEMNVHFREVRPGAGSLDYGVYLKRLAQLPDQPPLMLEHLPSPDEYDQARRYLLELGPKVGVKFG